ncbi:MAG TPA: hypothetical protein VG370_05000 [Chloroflexota bacterium]|nr:hypothetical protein [Chloroflexota bacterium]
MSFDAGPRPRGPSRRWMVRLFETSDKLEEHLNRNEVRPDQVASINVDGDGFFVLVYWVGGGPPADRRPAARAGFEERRPFRRREFEEGPERFEEAPRFERRPRPFDREGPPRRPGPPRRRER